MLINKDEPINKDELLKKLEEVEKEIVDNELKVLLTLINDFYECCIVMMKHDTKFNIYKFSQTYTKFNIYKFSQTYTGTIHKDTDISCKTIGGDKKIEDYKMKSIELFIEKARELGYSVIFFSNKLTISIKSDI